MMIIELLDSIAISFLKIPLLDKAPWSFFTAEWLNVNTFYELLIRFSLNLGLLLLLVRGIYYPVQKRKDFLFAYIIMGMIIFVLCYLLVDTDMDTGFALGLFAILGIVRYRTDTVPIKEMTYLFVAMGISVLNALAEISHAELLFANLVILLLAFIMEKLWLLRHEVQKVITYEKIELVKTENHAALKQDIEERTGIRINRLEVGKIDFLRDTAQIIIYFYEEDQKSLVE